MSLPDYLKNIECVPGWMTWYGEELDFGNSVNLHLIHRPPEAGQVTHVAKPVVFEMYAREARLTTLAPKPTLSLARETAVTLMTELWRIGVRPRGVSEVPRPEIDAIRGHLDDMRALVFRTPMICTQLIPGPMPTDPPLGDRWTKTR